MAEIQIEVAEVVAIMQEAFPREYTICMQRAHIEKLQALIESQVAEPSGDRI